MNDDRKVAGLVLNLSLQAVHDGVAQQKAKKVGTAFQQFREKAKENLKGVLERTKVGRLLGSLFPRPHCYNRYICLQCICVPVPLCTSTFVYQYVCVQVCLCTGMFVYQYVCLPEHLCTGTFVYRYVCVPEHLCTGTYR
jgi:hypothetical protein